MLKKRSQNVIFTDSFKFLDSAAKEVVNLSSKINNLLNRVLPSRILSQANIFNTTINVSQDLSKMVMLHVEDSLIEQNMLIAQKELSVRGLSTLTGHSPVRPISASGVIRLQLNQIASALSPSLVFNKTEFICKENNLKYVMIEDTATYSSSTDSIFVKVIEGTFVLDSYVASGLPLETINLDSVYPIENSNIKVYVNGQVWKLADSLYDMKANENAYLMKCGLTNQLDIVFGNNVYGKQLVEADTIQIEYLNSGGESGNLDENSTFTVSTGIYDTNGKMVDINEYATMTVESGFRLGSNGEDIEVTRSIAGFNSRSLVFTRPENLKAYLSRLSILSYIEAWSDIDTNIFHLLLAPNVSKRLSTYSDYLSIDISRLTLTNNEKDSILEYINESGHQSTSTEILIHDPVFSKYAIFCYVSGNINDKLATKTAIQNAISKEFLEKTLLDMTSITNELITLTNLEKTVIDATGLFECKINMVSEENELARINKKYFSFKTLNDSKLQIEGSGTRLTKRTANAVSFSNNSVGNKLEFVGNSNTIVKVKENVNPNLGFNELGSIVVESIEHIPILRGGFRKYSTDGNHIVLDKPIYIFYQTQNGLEEL